MDEANGHDDLLLTREVAERLRVSRSALLMWQQDERLPHPVHVGRPDAKRRTLRWRRSDIEAWAEGRYGQ